MGVALQEQGKLDEAVASYQKALSLKPDFAKARHKLYQQAHICDWEVKMSSVLSKFGIHRRCASFSLIALKDDPYCHRLRSENFAKKRF